MAVTKRAYSSTRKVFLYGSASAIALVAFLFTLANYGISIQMGNTTLKCAGNSLEPCVAYFNISLSNYSLCFNSNFKFQLNDSFGVNYTLYKADQRFKPDNPARWKPYTFSGCLKNETNYEFKLLVSKPIDKSLELNLKTGLINDVTVPFNGYKADDFFIELDSNKVSVALAESIYTLKNPSTFNITVDSTKFNATITKVTGTPTTDVEYFILRNITDIIGVPDYGQICELIPNGTATNCTTFQSGRHLMNVTAEKWSNLKDLGTFTFEPNKEYKIKVQARFLPKLGENSREWIPRINIENVDFKQNKWAWWNSSYNNYWNVSGVNTTYVDVAYGINITTNATVNLSSSNVCGIGLVNGAGTQMDFGLNDNGNTTFDAGEVITVFANFGAGSILSDGNYTIYYNNSTKTDCMNATHWQDDYYYLWDDFNDNSINTTKWRVIGNEVWEWNNSIQIRGDASWYSDALVTAMEFSRINTAWLLSTGSNREGSPLDNIDAAMAWNNATMTGTPAGVVWALNVYPTTSTCYLVGGICAAPVAGFQYREDGGGWSNMDLTNTISWSNFFNFRINQTTGWMAILNSTVARTDGAGPTTNAANFTFTSYDTGPNVTFDNTSIRKIADPEPTMFFTGTYQNYTAPVLGCNLNVTNWNITYGGNQQNVTCWANITGSVCNIYRNTSATADVLANTINNTPIRWGVNGYNFTCNGTGNASVSINYLTKAGIWTNISGIVNGTYSYAQTILALSNVSSTLSAENPLLEIPLTLNGTTKPNNTAITLGAGGWNWTVNSSGNQNFSASVNASWNLITQGTAQLSLAFNGTEADTIMTYPAVSNVTFWKNTSNGVMLLYQNGTLIGPLNSSTTIPPDKADRNSGWTSGGNMNDTVWTTISEHNSGAFGSFFPNYTIPANVLIYGNLTAYIHVGNSGSWVEISLWNYNSGKYDILNTYPASFGDKNVSVYLDSYNYTNYIIGGIFVFNISAKSGHYAGGYTGTAGVFETKMNFQNSSLSTSYSTIESLSARAYNFSANYTNPNYTATPIFRYLTVNKGATTIFLALNGTQGNRNYSTDSILNVTAWKTVNNGNISMWRNISTLMNTSISLNQIENLTSYSVPTGYNFTAWLNHENYTGSNVTWNTKIINVTVMIEMPQWKARAIEDTYTDSSSPDTAYGNESILVSGGISGTTAAYPLYGWFKFNISNLTYFDYASLNLYQTPITDSNLNGFDCNSTWPCVTNLYYSQNQTWRKNAITWNDMPSWDNFIIDSRNFTSNDSWKSWNITNNLKSVLANSTFMLRIPMLNIERKAMNITNSSNNTYYPWVNASVTKYQINATSCNGTIGQFQNGTCTPRGESSSQWIYNLTYLGIDSINISARMNVTMPSCMTHYLSTNSTLETSADYNVSNTTNVKVISQFAPLTSNQFWGFFVLNNCTAGTTTNSSLVWNVSYGV